MGTPGRAPKDPAERRRRNKDPMADVAVEIPDADRPDRPSMPLHPGHPLESWHEETVAFWDVVSEAPQTKVWTTTDWRFLHETMIVHDRWLKAESETGWANLERAVRSRQATLGMTDYDRRKSRLKIQFKPTDAAGQEQTPASRRPASRGTGRVDPGRFEVLDGGAGRDDDDASAG
jgi:hypothetical protein